jgi:hypothetical protein
MKITAMEKQMILARRKVESGVSVRRIARELGLELDGIMSNKLLALERAIDNLENNNLIIKAFDQAHRSLLQTRKEFNKLINVIPRKDSIVIKGQQPTM